MLDKAIESGASPTQFYENISHWQQSRERFSSCEGMSERTVILALSNISQILTEVLEGRLQVLERREGKRVCLSKVGKNLVKAIYEDYMDSTKEIEGREEALFLFGRAAKEIFDRGWTQEGDKKYRNSKGDEEIGFRMVINGLEARARYGIRSKIEVYLRDVVIPIIEQGRLRANEISSPLIRDFIETLSGEVPDRDKKVVKLSWEITSSWVNECLRFPFNYSDSLELLGHLFAGSRASVLVGSPVLLTEGDSSIPAVSEGSRRSWISGALLVRRLREKLFGRKEEVDLGAAKRALVKENEELDPHRAGRLRELFRGFRVRPVMRLALLATLICFGCVVGGTILRFKDKDVAGLASCQPEIGQARVEAAASEMQEPEVTFVEVEKHGVQSEPDPSIMRFVGEQRPQPAEEVQTKAEPLLAFAGKQLDNQTIDQTETVDKVLQRERVSSAMNPLANERVLASSEKGSVIEEDAKKENIAVVEDVSVDPNEGEASSVEAVEIGGESVEPGAEPAKKIEIPNTKETGQIGSRLHLESLVNPMTSFKLPSGTSFVYSTYREGYRPSNEGFWDFFPIPIQHERESEDPRFWDHAPDVVSFQNYYGYPNNGGFGRYYKEMGPYGEEEIVIVPRRLGPGVITGINIAQWDTDGPNPYTNQADPELQYWGGVETVGYISFYVDDGQYPVLRMSMKEFISISKDACWIYTQNGASGCILPIPYSKSIKVTLTGMPKWVNVAGVDYDHGTQVQSFTGNFDTEVLAKLAQVRQDPSRMPELNNLARREMSAEINAENPLVADFDGRGTVGGMHFRVPKGGEHNMWIQIHYKDEAQPTVNLPLKEFCGTGHKFAVHQSYLFGIREESDAYFFYFNIPISFENGVRVTLSTNGGNTKVDSTFFLSQESSNSRLRVWRDPGQILEAGSGDYVIDLGAPGGGRVIGILMDSFDYQLQNSDDPDWKFPYLEGNIFVYIDGVLRGIYTGWEDMTYAGFYWKWFRTTEEGCPIPGGATYADVKGASAVTFHRNFAGQGLDFGENLSLSFGHGSYGNNSRVGIGSTVWGYTFSKN